MNELLSVLSSAERKGPALFLSEIFRFVIPGEGHNNTGDYFSPDYFLKGNQAFINAVAGIMEDDGSNFAGDFRSNIKLKNSDQTVNMEYDFSNGFSYISSGENGSYIFNNYADDNGITVNGTLNFYIIFNETTDGYSYIFSGKLTFGGIARYSIEYNYVCNYSEESAVYQGYRRINNKFYSFNPDGTLAASGPSVPENFNKWDKQPDFDFQRILSS